MRHKAFQVPHNGSPRQDGGQGGLFRRAEPLKPTLRCAAFLIKSRSRCWQAVQQSLVFPSVTSLATCSQLGRRLEIAGHA